MHIHKQILHTRIVSWFFLGNIIYFFTTQLMIMHAQEKPQYGATPFSSIIAVDTHTITLLPSFTNDLFPTQMQKDAISVTLNTAQQFAITLYSAYIYGYTFRYVPAQKRYSIHEQFEIHPIHRIDTHAFHSYITDTYEKNQRRFFHITVQPSIAMQRWRSAWERSSIIRTSGHGKAPLSGGRDYALQAVSNAIKTALTHYITHTIPYKKQIFTGRLALGDIPHIYIKDNFYHANVRIHMIIDNNT